jgi:hypothetical protein
MMYQHNNVTRTIIIALLKHTGTLHRLNNIIIISFKKSDNLIIIIKQVV